MTTPECIRRLGLGCLRIAGPVALATTMLLIPPTAGGAEISAQPSPESWQYGLTRVVGYRIVLRTGQAPERVAVVYDTPEYFGLRDPLGSPLQDLKPGISGAGVIDGVIDQPQDPGSGEQACVRGSLPKLRRIDIGLPALSSTVLRLRFRLRLPYAGTDFRLPLRASTLGDRGEVVNSQRLRLPPPRVIGRTGVPLRVMRPRGGVGAYRVGREIRFRGATARALTGRHVALRISSRPARSFERLLDGAPRSRVLAQPRVDSRGRFSAAWRPRKPGWYELRPVYRGDRRFARDEGCPQQLLVSR